MNDHLGALRLFARVARTGSFSRAGREVGMSQSSASRTIKALEQRLGVTLLRRNTRAVVLSDVGREYLAQISDVLARLDEADAIAQDTDALHGTVRLALPASIAMRFVIPALEGFFAEHEKVRVDLLMADRRQDPVQEGIDVAISFGLAKDSPAKARHVATNKRILVAAPKYLDAAGTPRTPDDLSAHQIIAGSVGRQPGAWTFHSGGATVTIDLRPRLTLDVNEAAVAAAIAGLGILSTGYWGCRAELANGTLVHVLPAWTLDTLDMYVVLPGGNRSSRAARALADHLVRKLRPILRLRAPQDGNESLSRPPATRPRHATGLSKHSFNI